MDPFSFVIGFLAGFFVALFFAVTAVVAVTEAFIRIFWPKQPAADTTAPRSPGPPKDMATVLPGRVFEPIAKLGLATPWSGLPDLPGQRPEVSSGPFRVAGFGTPGYVKVMIVGVVGDLIKVRGFDPPHRIGEVPAMAFHPDDRVAAHEACAGLPRFQRPDVVVDRDG
jgi:hypothetical protein